MINKLNEKALLKADNTAFRTAVVRKIDELVRAVNEGVVWDNQVQNDRRTAEVEDMLIDTITAQIERDLLGGN